MRLPTPPIGRASRRINGPKRCTKKVDSLHALRAQAAESPDGKARPTKAPLDYDPAEQKTGGPALSTTIGERATSRLPFTIAGIGASAGGLEALSELLAHLPRETGMAIVILQHLDPTHESHLGQLLARGTKNPVLDIKTGMRPEPDFIYVLPANASVTLQNSQFKLGGRLPANGPMMPIDVFFRSLALEQQHRAIGVVLSGMGSDGTLGLQEIKGQGGITFAQDHETAKHFPMPASAIAAGYVDFVLAPAALAQELIRIARHPYVALGATRPARHALSPSAPKAGTCCGTARMRCGRSSCCCARGPELIFHFISRARSIAALCDEWCCTSSTRWLTT